MNQANFRPSDYPPSACIGGGWSGRLIVSDMQSNWHEHFTADFEAGTLKWKRRRRECFPTERSWKIWNGKNAGKVAGAVNSYGYRGVKFFGKIPRVHRILWEMANGPIPKGIEIDHIDRDKGNNRLSNLRLATRKENASNVGLRSSNTSGATGVFILKGSGKKQVWIGRKYIGTFASMEEAVYARRAAELMYHGQFAPADLQGK